MRSSPRPMRRLIVCLALSGVLLGASTATAAGVAPGEASPAQKTEAMTRFTAGKQAIDQKNWEKATLELRASLEVVNSPNARLVLSNRAASVTVVQRAVMQGASGYFVYVVKPDNTVSRRVVEIAGMQDGTAIIKSGVQVGDRIVVDGQYRLIDGSHVKVDPPKPQAEVPAAGATGKSG